MCPVVMPNTPHHALTGRVVLTNYSPDGDSVRFIPRSHESALAHLTALPGGHRLRRGHDGAVQLRLQGVDAPESHFMGVAQPLGARAREGLLRWLGFTRTDWRPHDQLCTACEPADVTATILSSQVDVHGRVIAYLLRGHVATEGAAQAIVDDVTVAERHLAVSATHHLLETGLAYFLAYDSIPATHAVLLRERAAAARKARRGVWACDVTTSGFTLHDVSSIGPRGEQILPKLFRRCVSYLATGHTKHEASFTSWLRQHSSEGIDNLDDVVRTLPGAAPDADPSAPSAPVRLSDLVRERGRRISLTVDPLDLVFREK